MDRIAVVNGLRGMAIIGVTFHHLFLGGVVSGMPDSFAALRPLLTNGWTGVNMFFILSGFVLFLPYAAGRRAMVSAADAWLFYRGRFLRLMPLYAAAGLVVLVIAGPVLSREAFDGLFLDLATLRFVVRPRHFGVAINFPLWSVGVEVLFSLAFPIVVVAIRRLGLLPVVVASLICALAARIEGRIWDLHPIGPNFISDNIFGRLDEFVIGMAMAAWYEAGAIPAWARHLMWPSVALVVVAWIGFYECQYRGFALVAMSFLNNVLDLGFAGILTAALAPRGGPHRVLTFKPLQVAGMMCYSVYIWQGPVRDALQPTQGLAFTLLVLVALSALSYRYVEFGKVRDWRALFAAVTAKSSLS